jgi:Family of unknown function (DUF6508)
MSCLMPASTPQNANQIKDVRDRTLSCGWVAHSESWYYTGRTCRSDPLIMPWFEMSEVADKFISMANGFIETLKDFDWTKWIQQPEGQKLFR